MELKKANFKLLRIIITVITDAQSHGFTVQIYEKLNGDKSLYHSGLVKEKCVNFLNSANPEKNIPFQLEKERYGEHFMNTLTVLLNKLKEK